MNQQICFTIISIIICFLFQANKVDAKTTSTIASGAWGNVANWSNGLPATGDIVNVNHLMDFTNVNINVGANTTYNFNDGASGSTINQSIGVGSATSVLNIYTIVNCTSSLYLVGGTIHVGTGGTLTVQPQVSQGNGTYVTIDAGGNFNVIGSYLNNGGSIHTDGLLAIDGTYDGQNANAVVTGSGDITTTGRMHGLNGTTIFGVVNPDCPGPCSGRNLCGRVASSLPASAAYCSTPILLTGAVNNDGGVTPIYHWQSSATNTEAGFSDISGATNATLSVTPAAKTYYRVKVTVSNCTSISPVSVVSVSTCSKTWVGGTADWYTDSNWSPAGVPNSGDDVVIPNVSIKPVINGGIANTKDIVIDASSSLTFTSGTLNLYGNFISNGTFTTSSGSTLAFRGTITQSLSGAPILHNVIIDNTINGTTNVSGVSIFTPTTIKGTLSLFKGVLTTNLYLTIDFDAGGNIGYNTSDIGSVYGNVTGIRQVKAASHYIAAPFNGVTSGQVGETTPLWVSPYWKMYSKDFTNQNWIAVTNTITPMSLGEGFSLALPADAPLIFTGDYDHTFTLTGESYSNAAADKYILLGNPYPSTLNWDSGSGWTKTNVGGAIYYWDGIHNRTASYVSGVGTNGGTPFIPAMQAYMVTTRGTGGSSSVSVDNTTRISSQNPSFLATQDDTIQLMLLSTTDPANYDEAIIRFNALATVDFDFDLDAHKILNSGPTPSVYTTSNGTIYSINSFQSVELTPSIPVAAKLPADGGYELKVVGGNPNIEYLLLDKLLNVTQDMNANNTYTFNGLITDNENRFELHLQGPATGVLSANLANGLGIYSTSKGFIIKTDCYAGRQAEIEIMDVAGKSIKSISGKTLSKGATYVPLEIVDGTYLIKVNVDSYTFAGMIVLVK